jgi:hypothetical protein
MKVVPDVVGGALSARAVCSAHIWSTVKVTGQNGTGVPTPQRSAAITVTFLSHYRLLPSCLTTQR